jgi:hypothetical protein
MALTRRQQMVSSIFLVIALMTIVSLVYRAFTGNTQARLAEYRRRAEAAQPIRKSLVTPDRVVMMRGETVTVNRTRLVYRGLQDGTLHLDLYLLDLDAQYPYPKRIPRALARQEFRLGPERYQLLAVSRKALTLKILK